MRLSRILAPVLALGIAGAGAGCGSSTPARHAETTGGVKPARVSARVAHEQAVLHRQVLAALHQPDHQRYGGIPAALRSHQGDPGRVLTATPDHPVTTAAGSPVRLRPAGGSGVAEVIGPYVPQRVMGTDAASAQAKFVMTFSHLRGDVPLPVAAFGIVDQSQTFHRPAVKISRHGATATVVLRAYLPQGGGRLVYSPGARPLVTWEFSQETD